MTQRPSHFSHVTTPLIIQVEAVECGAVALGIVMGYYGKFLSVEELRVACGVSRSGTSAYNMMEAAKSYGLEGDAYSAEMEDLFQLKMPVILFWEFNHFVVLEGFDRDAVRINDPASGPRKVTYEDFDVSFSGPVFTLQPRPDFAPSRSDNNPWELLKPLRPTFVKGLQYLVLVGLCLLIPSLAIPALTQAFISNVVLGGYSAWGSQIVLGLGLATAMIAILSYMQAQVVTRLYISISTQLRSNLSWQLLHLPMNFYSQRFGGEIAYRLSLVDPLCSRIAEQLIPVLLNAMLAVVYGFALFFYDVQIALTTLLTAALSLGLLTMVNNQRQDAYASLLAAQMKSSSRAIANLESIETIKATGGEIDSFKLWAGRFTRFVNSNQVIWGIYAKIEVLPGFLVDLSNLLLLGLGVWRILEGTLTIGMLIGLQILLRNFLWPVMQLMNFSQVLRLAKVDLTRLHDISINPMDPLLVSQTLPSMNPSKLEGYVDVQNLSFSYSPREPNVLENINFQMRPGKSIAIVGPSGSGKSTIAALLAGLYLPSSGTLLFDGIPLAAIPHEQFTSSLALVEQAPFLFQGSMRDNITLSDLSKEQTPLFTAAKDACIHDLIVSRKGSYDMEVGENGANLSGGRASKS